MDRARADEGLAPDQRAALALVCKFLALVAVVRVVEAVALRVKTLGINLVGRETWNALLIGVIFVCAAGNAYQSATTITHPLKVLFLGYSHTATDPAEFLWNWGGGAAILLFLCYWTGTFQAEEKEIQPFCLMGPALWVFGWVFGPEITQLIMSVVCSDAQVGVGSPDPATWLMCRGWG